MVIELVLPPLRERGVERVVGMTGGNLQHAAIVEAVRRSPMDRVEELRSLPQVTAGTYDRIAPHVTVHGDGRVNVNSASVPVLFTLS